MLSFVAPLASNLLLWIWLLAALWVWAGTRGRRRGRRWGIALLAGFWLASCRPVAELWLLPLERQYDRPTVAGLREQGVRQVVVLTGGGFSPDGEILSSALPIDSARRFLGGIELGQQLGSDGRLIFSGSAGRGRRGVLTAEVMRDLARRFGLRQELVAEATSGSTAEHPHNVRPLLEEGPFALVTSAYHMPRAMRSFRVAGLEPIAYPVDSSPRGGYGWQAWLPSLQNLRTVETAWREYLALLFYRIRGW